MKMKALVAGVALALAGTSMAATSNPAAPVVGAAAAVTGTTGTVDVTLTIADIVHISGLAELAMGTYAGDSVDETTTDTFCVFRNGTGNYNLTLTSANATAGGVHQLASGANKIPYTLSYDDAGAPVANILSSVVPVARNGGGVALNPTCSANTADNGTLAVTVAAADMDAAQPGNYLDTITITVTAI